MQVAGRPINNAGTIIMEWDGSAVIDLVFGSVNLVFSIGAIPMAAWMNSTQTIQLEGVTQGQAFYLSLDIPMKDRGPVWVTFGIVPLPGSPPMAQVTYNAGG